MAKKKTADYRAVDYGLIQAPGIEASFGQIFYSLVSNKRFLGLSNVQKLVFIYCIVNRNTKQGKSCLLNAIEDRKCLDGYKDYEFRTNELFVFPAKQMSLYGIDRANGTRAMQELEKQGFIESVNEINLYHKVKIYRFVETWKR